MFIPKNHTVNEHVMVSSLSNDSKQGIENKASVLQFCV